MIPVSLRWRIQLWHGLLLVAVLAGFGLTAFRFMWQERWRRIDEDLVRRLDVLFRPPHFGHGAGPPHPGPFHPPPGSGGPPEAEFRDRLTRRITEWPAPSYAVLWDPAGREEARSSAAPAALPAPSPADHPPRPGPGLFRTRGEWREASRCLPGGGCLLVGISTAPELTAVRRTAASLVLAALGILLVGLAGGAWLTARALRPLETIAETAAGIAAGDLSRRIAVGPRESSELTRLAAVLNSAFERLDAAFARQTRFTADASHELRTPLSVLLSKTQTTLARDRTSAEYRDALETCERAAQRMRQLTESLLRLARLDAGQQENRDEPVDLARIAADALALIRPLADARGLTIDEQLDPAPLTGDPGRLGQIVLNLLSNAIQYNRDRGEIRLATGTAAGRPWLTVADTGEGIPAADLPHVFERFYRVDKARSRAEGRTGLGLAITRAIVESHGGEISAVSEPGAGTTFTVRL